MPKEDENPAEICDHELVPICVGEDLLIVSLQPNWPIALCPHANNNPSDLIAKTWKYPAATWDQLKADVLTQVVSFWFSL